MREATLRDVATRAGVSIRTVSNVVNGYAPVSDTLRAKVETALNELDYRPNLIARNLKQGRSGMLCLVVPELDVPYFAELARAVIAAGRRHGYAVMVDQTDADPVRERELLTRNSRLTLFDGLILSPLTLSAQELRERGNKTPVVLLGEHLFDGSFSHVAIDNVSAARDATEHLISLGRTRIAAVGDQPYRTGETAQLRTAGYRQALERAGLPFDPALVRPTERFHRHLGATAATALMALPSPPDAIFCYNDLLALGALRGLLTAGVRVPDDVAVIGIDGIEEGEFATPSLSTIVPDKQQIADLAVESLVALIEQGATPAPAEVRASHTLLARESTLGRA
ncbi:LacI family transcriptional regulator [Actinoplanes bogorensis]|uniref:LacI family transcriptional regulator n=1 Tax=Paractinoplanes bogorensis TaxID=1610840 RepID=A0ABS5YUY1_9ACTN|nr:LacI family DNA-binding transcriptional regulator [Actinoplanes bogorensis]MBU2666876.1 LacI family transcriptional regulator [Actinoplanes bogorensis]